MPARTTSVLREEVGATIMEYALILALIAVTCLFGTRLLGSNAQSEVDTAASSISAASAPAASGGSNGGGSNDNDGGNGNSNGFGNNPGHGGH
jgi:Flp pilus assembly pilin Flp